MSVNKNKNKNGRRESYRSKTQNKPFDTIYCMNSLYLFSKENPFRMIVHRILSHKGFDRFMLSILCFSSLLLVFDTYLDPINYSRTEEIFMKMSNIANGFLCMIFAIEVVLKSICYGFILDKRSYMRNMWNTMDFFLTVCYIMDILTPNDSESHMIQVF